MRRLAAGLGLSLLVISCSGVPQPFGDLTNVMSAQVNGAPFRAWVPNNRLVGYLGVNNSDSVPGIELIGNAADATPGLNDQLTLALLPFHGVGRYTICNPGYDPDSAAAYYYVSSPTDTTFQIRAWLSRGPTCSGVAVVQSFDSVQHTITGTFHFTAVNPSDSSTISVTAGTFNGTYLPN